MREMPVKHRSGDVMWAIGSKCDAEADRGPDEWAARTSAFKTRKPKHCTLVTEVQCQNSHSLLVQAAIPVSTSIDHDPTARA